MTEQQPALFDSHVHLQHEEYDADREEVFMRAIDAGVRQFMLPATDLESAEKAIRLCSHRDGVFVAAGYHPHEASRATDVQVDGIRALLREAPVRAVGEIGLDYHYDFAPRDVQMEVFRLQLEIAAEHSLPVVIHTRESLDDAIEAVRAVVTAHPEWCTDALGSRRGVFHCFTGSPDSAREVISLGFFVSFPGILTFKNSPVSATFREVPIDRVLIETDGPYMAPVPMRGKRNEPSFLPYIAAKMSELSGKSIETIASCTSGNAERLFNTSRQS